MTVKDRFRNLKPSEDAKRLLTPDQLKRLEEGIQRLKEMEFEELSSPHPEKFDAKDMQPLDAPPVDLRRKKK
jgi:hypothetical protein